MLLPFLFGFCGLIAFVLHQKLMAKHPVIKLAILANRTAVIGHCTTLLHGILLWILLYYLPLYYEGVREYSPLTAGLAVFPETFTVAPAAIITGLSIRKFGTYRWAVVLGWSFTTVGMGLLCLLNESMPVVGWVSINILPGLGLGMLVPAAGTAVQAASTKEYEANAISMFYLLRAAGQTVGVAIGGAVFRNQVKNVAGLGSGATADELLKMLQERRQNGKVDEAVVGIILKALRAVWSMGCAVAGAGLLISLWMKAYPLGDREGQIQGEEADNEGKRPT